MRQLSDLHTKTVHRGDMAAGDGYLAVPSLDEDFSLATLRDQLAFAATYPDEAFSRYGTGQELIAEVTAWALK